MERYRHTQYGYVFVGVVAVCIVMAASGTLFVGEARAGASAALAILVACLVLFPSLTTSVDSEQIHCFFGPGLIRRRILLTDVESASVVRNPWVYGWGLRLIPGGWLWNVSGLDAVELKLRSGRVFRIGTDQSHELHRAISDALRSGGGGSARRRR